MRRRMSFTTVACFAQGTTVACFAQGTTVACFAQGTTVACFAQGTRESTPDKTSTHGGWH
jgi:hypothetical protein